MLEESLNILLKKKLIKGWKIEDIVPTTETEPVVNLYSTYRHTQRLTLVFNDETSLAVETFCSGSDENTSFELYSFIEP
jgi:hypothetical protein